MNTLNNFADLAARFRRGIDYGIVIESRPASSVAVVAPHGGAIERATSAIARALAGDAHNLYLFEGRLQQRNYEELHLTSHRFDEPECLALIGRCDHVVTVHGYNPLPDVEPDPGVVIGGLDAALGARLAEALREAGIAVLTDGPRFRALDPNNVCNRGRLGRGVQLELSNRLRGGPLEPRFIAAVRSVLSAVGSAGSA